MSLGPARDEPIRVAHLLDARHYGGAEEMARRLIRAAPATGVEARAYILSEGRLAEVLREQGLPLRVFPSAGRLDLRMLGELARAAREDRVQIIQAHTSRTHLIARLVTRLVARGTGMRNITTIHSPIAQDENQGAARHPLRAWVERLGRPWTDRIVTVSREERDRLIGKERVAPAKIQWIPNGVEPLREPLEQARAAARQRLDETLGEAGISGAGLRVAMIAQMRPRKGPEVLLRAFAAFREAGGEGALLMIGDDSFTEGAGYLGQLKAEAERLGIGGQTLFTGFMAEPWSLAAGADVLVLPSLFGEGLPLVLLEGMQHGLPLLASESAGNRELIDAPGGACGWLHTPGDAGQLAEQLSKAFADPTERARRGIRGEQSVALNYEINKVAEEYRKIYEATQAAL